VIESIVDLDRGRWDAGWTPLCQKVRGVSTVRITVPAFEDRTVRS